jgi:TPR repeat protein
MRASTVVAIALTTPLCCGAARAADCVTEALRGIEAGRPEAAVRALEKGARRGDERCKFVLGMWSLSGTGMEPDPAAGGVWVREAAEEGLPVAQSSLGLLHASGWGVEKDDEAAAEWYRAAAERGDPLGQAALGAACFLGVGVPKDRVEGYSWTALAAEAGNEKARSHLPAMEASMSADELERAKARVAGFRPAARPPRRRLSQWQRLRALGLHGLPTEYERFFGY